MKEPAKGFEKPYLTVYVTCRRKWVARVLKQIEEFQVGDKGRREELGFAQRCNFEPLGDVIQVDENLAIVLNGRVELWVTYAEGAYPLPAVALVVEAGG